MTLEFYTGFVRSSFCHSGSCVEVAPVLNGGIAVRDSKNASLPQLVYTTEEWVAFLRGVKAGEFDFGLVADQDPHPAT